MQRLEDWPARLAAFVDAARARPFRYGEWDCCVLAADWVLACTGADVMAPWRGTYRDKRSAVRILARLGGLHRTGGHVMLGEPIPALQARRGDVVLREDPALGPALGICLGARAAFPGPSGLVFRPVKECRQAWRI